MRLKRLHVLLIRSFLGPFILIFFVVLFLLLMQFLWRYIDDLVGKGLTFGVIAELMFYTSASLVPMALPLAILMASLMTCGNMGENYELIALKSAGISLQRILLPLIILNVFISIGAFFFANNMLPIANLKMRSLLHDIRKQRPEMQIRPGEFYNGIDKYKIRIDDKNPETNMMYGLQIYDHTERNGNRIVTFADSGAMKITEDSRYLFITLYSGISYKEEKEERRSLNNRHFPHRTDKFGKQNMVIELSGFGLERTDESLFRSNYQMMNLNQLGYYRDSLNIEINGRINTLYQNMKERNYYRSPYFLNRKLGKIKADTIAKTDTVNINHLFQQYTLREQKEVYRDAMNAIRNGTSYLSSYQDIQKDKSRRLNKYILEWNRKFTIAFACFIFLFIGAPLGAIIRKGGIGMPVVISTVLFIFYYIITLTTDKMVAEGKINSTYGTWIASVLLTVIGVFLTYKATTDSVILNIDTYLGVFKKLFGKLKLSKGKAK